MADLVVTYRDPAQSLDALAKRINGLIGEATDIRERLAVALAEARDRVPRETGENFYVWAARELRRSDGSQWPYWTLAKYVSWGKDPQKLQRSRAQIAALGRSARRDAGFVISRAETVDEQVRVLMATWEVASLEARKIFLQQIAGDEPQRQSHG